MDCTRKPIYLLSRSELQHELLIPGAAAAAPPDWRHANWCNVRCGREGMGARSASIFCWTYIVAVTQKSITVTLGYQYCWQVVQFKIVMKQGADNFRISLSPMWDTCSSVGLRMYHSSSLLVIHIVNPYYSKSHSELYSSTFLDYDSLPIMTTQNCWCQCYYLV